MSRVANGAGIRVGCFETSSRGVRCAKLARGGAITSASGSFNRDTVLERSFSSSKKCAPGRECSKRLRLSVNEGLVNGGEFPVARLELDQSSSGGVREGTRTKKKRRQKGRVLVANK